MMKDVIGFEGRYGVTDDGRVWSYLSKKWIAQRYDKDGYLRVSIYDANHKIWTYLVHKLVAMAFVPNPENKPEVNHLDECITHNYASNLEWSTHKDNLNYGTRNERAGAAIRKALSGKNGHKKQVYCPELDRTFESTYAVQMELGIDQGSVSRAARGKAKSAGKHPVTGAKLHWYFVEEVSA